MAKDLKGPDGRAYWLLPESHPWLEGSNGGRGDGGDTLGAAVG